MFGCGDIVPCQSTPPTTLIVDASSTDPPLPSIEVATFCDELPRHWETLTEKIHKRGKLEIELGGRKLTHAEFYKEKHHFAPGKDIRTATERSIPNPGSTARN